MSVLKNYWGLFFIIAIGFLQIENFNISFFEWIENDFQNKASLFQVRRYFILFPQIIILSKIFKNPLLSFLGGFVLFMVGSYNIVCILTAFVFCEFLFIELWSGGQKKQRREILCLTLALFPCFLILIETSFSLFFIMLVLLSVFDIFSIVKTKQDSIPQQIKGMFFATPLRSIILIYCIDQNIPENYLIFIKISLLFFFVLSVLIGAFYQFDLKSFFVVSQIFLLLLVVSDLRSFYMDCYFLISLITILKLQNLVKRYFFIWPTLLLSFCFLNGSPFLLAILDQVVSGSIYLKFLAISLIFIICVILFESIESFKKSKMLAEEFNLKEIIFILLIVSFVLANGAYITEEVSFSLGQKTKFIVISFFVFIAGLFYLVDFSNIGVRHMPHLIRIKRIGFRVFDEVSSRFIFQDDRTTFFEFLESCLRLIGKSFFYIISTIQKIIEEIFFIIVDLYKNREVKKYQHLMAFLLIFFSFLLLGISMESK